MTNREIESTTPDATAQYPELVADATNLAMDTSVVYGGFSIRKNGWHNGVIINLDLGNQEEAPAESPQLVTIAADINTQEASLMRNEDERQAGKLDKFWYSAAGRKTTALVVALGLTGAACSSSGVENEQPETNPIEATTATSTTETISIESITNLGALSSKELLELPTDIEIPVGALYVERDSPSNLNQAQGIINEWAISMGVYENLGNGSAPGIAELYLDPGSTDWGSFVSLQQASSGEVTTYRRKNSAQSEFWTTSVITISSFEKVTENEFVAEGVEVITDTFDPNNKLTVSDEFRFVRYSFQVDGATHLAWVLAPPK